MRSKPKCVTERTPPRTQCTSTRWSSGAASPEGLEGSPHQTMKCIVSYKAKGVATVLS